MDQYGLELDQMLLFSFQESDWNGVLYLKKKQKNSYSQDMVSLA